jgi:hypothetical protein
VTPVATGSAVAGILILIVAIFALVQTWRLRIATDKSIARERRTAFELEVLRDLLGPVVSAGENAVSSPAVRALLAALPLDDLPLLRLCQKVEDDNEVDYTIPGSSIRQALLDEMQRQRPGHDLSEYHNTDRLVLLTLADEIRASMEKRVSSASGGR